MYQCWLLIRRFYFTLVSSLFFCARINTANHQCTDYRQTLEPSNQPVSQPTSQPASQSSIHPLTVLYYMYTVTKTLYIPFKFCLILIFYDYRRVNLGLFVCFCHDCAKVSFDSGVTNANNSNLFTDY